MSGLKENQCELPEKPWKDYSSDEIRRYFIKNLKNTDCSFIAEDKKESKAAKVYKSFKWILWEMSPVLKEMLDDEKNRAKNCQEIIVSNPKYIEAILFYGHFKVVNTKIVNLVDFYEASKEYQVKALEEEVIKMFDSDENQKNQNWVKLFWLSHVKYPEDQQMTSIFEKVKGHVDCFDTFAEANIDLISEFDEVLFDTFFNIMLSRLHRLKCFKITEVYLIQHFFEGNKDKNLEEIDPLERNLVEWYMNKMFLGNHLIWSEYNTGPVLSNLFTTEQKIEHLKIYKESRLYGDIPYKEIMSYIQKLSESESNLKTENNKLNHKVS